MAPAILKTVSAVVAARRLRKQTSQNVPQSQPSTTSSNITSAPDQPWVQVGPAKEHLFVKLKELYWVGVRAELENILFALKEWQLPEYADAEAIETEEDFVHGFDTFVDQVSQGARKFASRYESQKQAISARKQWQHTVVYNDALKQRATDLLIDQSSARLKLLLREEVKLSNQASSEPLLEQRAKLLLQSAGFLDIEKLIEHRPPLDGWSFWRRPGVPQLTVAHFTQDHVPVFGSHHCSACMSAIRGSMFRASSQSDEKADEDWTICESCYFERFYGDSNIYKVHKHCILDDSITSAAGRRMCRCDRVLHSDQSGRYRTLFPVAESDNHRISTSKGGLQCPLMSMGDMVAESKYDSMQTLLRRRIPLSDEKRIAAMSPDELAKYQKGQRKEAKKEAKLQTGVIPSLVDETDRVGTEGKSAEVKEAEADEDIPFFMKRYVDRYPFGNVHMALRVGPLILENGVAHTKGGALATLREPSILSPSGNSPCLDSEHHSAYTISEDPDRTLWSQSKRQRARKRYKAIMKQIVGVPFTGIYLQDLENSIIQSLVSACRLPFDDPGLSRSDRDGLVKRILKDILDKVKVYLEDRIDVYLYSISAKLADPTIKLRWSATTNNCQSFCDAILDWDIFGQFIPFKSPKAIPKTVKPSQGPVHPLYLISFVTRSTSYQRNKVKNKYDVPSGLTEEYLLKFRYGRHEESDIIDTLHEWWYDFGAFGGHLYENQALFPWDCTEAFGRYPTRCGDCNLAKHLWAFPFDSWSIISLHLGRDRYLYAPTNGSKQVMSDSEWFINRLTLLHSQNLLLRVGAAMHRTGAFIDATKWLHSASDPKVDRLKLGGIHRAQPFSHTFDEGLYHQYFIAEWAIYEPDVRRKRYEELRDGRVRLKDVPGRRLVNETEKARQEREMETMRHGGVYGAAFGGMIGIGVFVGADATSGDSGLGFCADSSVDNPGDCSADAGADAGGNCGGCSAGCGGGCGGSGGCGGGGGGCGGGGGGCGGGGGGGG